MGILNAKNCATALAALAGLLAWSVAVSEASPQRPSLVLTAAGVKAISNAGEAYPLLNRARGDAKRRVEQSLAEGVVVPEPVDPGGGYTHERHKENARIIHDAGVLYQLTGDQRYLQHTADFLLAYADIYRELPLHPARRGQTPGRLFWQSLNESVWLVYAIQGFDAVADALPVAAREKIETDLLRPVADFLSLERAQEFRRIHNHGTWAAAAVGMTGYALRDQSLVDRAILGLDGDGSSGFIAQLDQLFSPDGYYTEGPYYQRYALMPFVLFAQAIDNNEPERKIFEHRDGILLKAIDATVQQSYAGKFFPINDALKEKGLDTVELVYGVAAAFELTGAPGLLSVAEYQGETVLTSGGVSVARAVAAGEARDFRFKSMLLRDGANGDEGGLAILRMGEGDLAQTVVVKNTGHGMGHGHFDKLSYLLYDNGTEVLTDYGAARFLNVPSKDGGRYLPENESWAKQTVAHNTLVIDEASQFGAKWRESQKHWPEIIYFDAADDLNVVSARLDKAYPGASIVRTVLQFRHDAFPEPILVDLLRVSAEKPSRYDLPFYFAGQVIDFGGGDIAAKPSSREALGRSAGYQHLWLEATGRWKSGIAKFSWLNASRFYTLHSAAPAGTEGAFVRTGADDPNFNLRSEQGFMLRAPRARNAVFATIIEPHGVYDPANEVTVGSESRIETVRHWMRDGADLIELRTKDGAAIHVAVSHDPTPGTAHRLKHGGGVLEWSGFAAVIGEFQ